MFPKVDDLDALYTDALYSEVLICHVLFHWPNFKGSRNYLRKEVKSFCHVSFSLVNTQVIWLLYLVWSYLVRSSWLSDSFHLTLTSFRVYILVNKVVFVVKSLSQLLWAIDLLKFYVGVHVHLSVEIWPWLHFHGSLNYIWKIFYFSDILNNS